MPNKSAKYYQNKKESLQKKVFGRYQSISKVEIVRG